MLVASGTGLPRGLEPPWSWRFVPAHGFRPPVTLEGRFIRLVPLEPGHVAGLARAGRDPEVWRYLPYGPRTDPDRMAELVAMLLGRQSAGTDLAFTIQLRGDGALVGMTRYLSIDRENSCVEIGGTWVSPAWSRTPVNTESKRLLLGHAFEAEGVHRVQLKTDLRNERSQRAIERLGATREGILREHFRLPSGYHRSSVLYSILADEWPSVRARLDGYLRRPWAGTDAAPMPAGRPGDASP